MIYVETVNFYTNNAPNLFEFAVDPAAENENVIPYAHAPIIAPMLIGYMISAMCTKSKGWGQFD